MSTVPQAFYVYTLAYPDGQVFYVGKGCGNRINQHEREARKGLATYKCRVIRKIWADGGQVIKAIIFQTDDEAAAFDVEKRTIAFYGRDSLTNHTDGGQGLAGRTVPAETRAKISTKLLGHPPTRIQPMSAEARARIGQAHRGKVMSAESRAKMSASMKGRIIPQSTRDAVAKATRGRVVSDETREKIAAARRGTKRGPEVGMKVAIKKAKTYAGFVSPDGQVYLNVTNLKAFCREHGLQSGNMVNLTKGRAKTCQGWTLYQEVAK